MVNASSLLHENIIYFHYAVSLEKSDLLLTFSQVLIDSEPASLLATH